MRAAICGGLAWAGVELDDACDRSAADPISVAHARCPVRVLPSQDDEQIAGYA